MSICDGFQPGIPPDTNTTSYLCVDRNGCCNFTLVQAAVDVIPDLTFQGQGYLSTAISWNDTANSSHGTFYSGSVQVFGANFIAKNISFMVRNNLKLVAPFNTNMFANC